MLGRCRISEDWFKEYFREINLEMPMYVSQEVINREIANLVEMKQLDKAK